jgi:hypothetical protein
MRAAEWDNSVKLRLARLRAGSRANLIALFAKFDACNLALALLVEQPDLSISRDSGPK